MGDQLETINDQSRRSVLLLFDVDGTLTPSRLPINNEVDECLQDLRKRVTIGLVGGSNLEKIAEQTLPINLRESVDDPLKFCLSRYDYVFAENGLVAYRKGSLIGKKNLISEIGDEKLQRFINFCLLYMSKLTLPVKRGNFIEFRNGMLNICPVGRSCSQQEREQFHAYDQVHKIREQFICELEAKFGAASDDPLGLVFACGGQISFDAYPKGWDKTFCLNLLQEKYEHIHFFGDKTDPGGNDHEIYADPRTIGHSVKAPEDTLRILKTLGM